MKTTTKKVIDVYEWDELVQNTYGKPYSFQQQDGCKDRGTVSITIPSSDYSNDKEMNDSIPEVINGDKMGVKFSVWLARDPDTPLNPTEEELKDCDYYWGKTEEDAEVWKKDKSHIIMFYERNFYPDVLTIANDLYSKGLIKKGNYLIDIDW